MEQLLKIYKKLLFKKNSNVMLGFEITFKMLVCDITPFSITIPDNELPMSNFNKLALFNTIGTTIHIN